MIGYAIAFSLFSFLAFAITLESGSLACRSLFFSDLSFKLGLLLQAEPESDEVYAQITLLPEKDVSF